MAIPREKIKAMADRERRRGAERRAAIAARMDAAFVEARRLVDDFKALDPAIRKVVLFGSLATGEVTSPDFDIDLAVICSKERYLSLVARALDSDFRVDVIDLSAADERILGSVARDGVILHEK